VTNSPRREAEKYQSVKSNGKSWLMTSVERR